MTADPHANTEQALEVEAPTKEAANQAFAQHSEEYVENMRGQEP